MISWNQIESRAVDFSRRWKNCTGDERQYGQTFEKDFMQVFGVEWREGLHEHQITLLDGSLGYVDYFLPGKIIIEMKSKGKSLDRAYSQVMGYVKALKPEDKPVLAMVSDFDKIRVYNLEKDHPYKPFRVGQLKQKVRIFGLLAGYGDVSQVKTDIELNTDASYKMARIHDALKANGYTGQALEVYLVRLLFCLFADDTGIFEKDSFEHYIHDTREDGSDLSGRLAQLFDTLNTPPEKRMKNLQPELSRFRYINGMLFSENLPMAVFDGKMRQALLECCDFDWTQISPAIFGAMFQGVMNQQERRELGAHYTSEENIMKVINPLFLEGLYDEFERSKSTTAELHAFHDRLSNLTFLDPACGCGNFLIITYQKLRELEHEVLKLLYDTTQTALTTSAFTKVGLHQFYGIEVEGFPCEIAKVSLLLMKHLMDQEVSHYFGMNLIDFPIRDNANILQGNALRMDWAQVVPPEELDYIIGNPPFIGGMQMNAEQTADMKDVLGHVKGFGEMDYVCAWYYKAAKYIKDYHIECAFVSTNSICQGQQVLTFWKEMIQNQSININYAHRSFVWNNQAKAVAKVHCVIVGFSKTYINKPKMIYDEEGAIEAKNISPYLVDAPNVFLQSRSTSLSDVSQIRFGSMPRDGGHLVLTLEDKGKLLSQCPQAEPWVRPYIGSFEFINKKERWCLWLVDVSPGEMRKCPFVLDRIEKVQQFRTNSVAAGTRKFAETPSVFCQIAQPDNGNYLAIPKVSSERRRYIPIGMLDSNIIASDLLFLVPDASTYEFGILTSNVHMAWMRAVAGRLKSDYRYSKDIVYNNFVWPEATDAQKAHIEKTAQAILDVRAKYPNDSYADLYNDIVMPPDLRRAHQDNDRAVWEAYGRAWPISDENACVAHLMKLYQQATQA